MPEVGVERLGAGHGEKHQAEDGEADQSAAQEKRHAVGRIEGGEHARLLDDAHDADAADDGEPEQDNRAEQGRHLGRAASLHGEQPDQDHDRQRHHRLLESGGDDLEALDSRDHGERRRDGGIAVEEGCAGNAEQQDHVLAALGHRLRQRHQREGAAFTVEVRPQQNEHVLERHEQEQRPHDQRQDAEHRVLHDGGLAGRGNHGFAKGVDRAGADIAVDDADGTERQGPELARLRVLQLGALGSNGGRMCHARSSSCRWPLRPCTPPSLPKIEGSRSHDDRALARARCRYANDIAD